MSKGESVFEEEYKQLDTLLDNVEGMDDEIKVWREINISLKKLKELDEKARTKVKIHMKEKKWERYVSDETDISVTLSMHKKEVVDKQQLKMILSEAQYSQVVRVTTYERLLIMTPENRERLKKSVRKK